MFLSMPGIFCVMGPWSYGWGVRLPIPAPLIRLASQEKGGSGAQDLWLWACDLENQVLFLPGPHTAQLRQSSWERSPLCV